VSKSGRNLHAAIASTFVKMDFDDVLSELNEAGFAFDGS
jgi:hypothetical protein